jgi:DNA-directed RNA polymerase specialized sigma24 family protein
MEPGLLKKVVESQFDLIKSQDDYVNKSKKTLRSIHYLNKGAIPSVKKKEISSRFRGMMERYQTFQRIQHAMNFLYDEHGDYTYQQIADLLGLSLRTVKRRVKLKKEDFEREYLEFKEELEKVVNESNMDLLKIQGK